jgi:thiol-disulfide isomerase/thioredoxin
VKRLFPVILSLCFYGTSSAQQVEAVKIEELNAYITKAEQPLIINFWATWCKPCIAEMPYIQQAAQQYKDSGVQLIMVSLDFPEAYPNDITAFIKNKSLDGTFFWLDESNADHFCPVIDKQWQGSIPATLLLNGKTNYRKFFERKITPDELHISLKEMLEQ